MARFKLWLASTTHGQAKTTPRVALLSQSLLLSAAVIGQQPSGRSSAPCLCCEKERLGLLLSLDWAAAVKRCSALLLRFVVFELPFLPAPRLPLTSVVSFSFSNNKEINRHKILSLPGRRGTRTHNLSGVGLSSTYRVTDRAKVHSKKREIGFSSLTFGKLQKTHRYQETFLAFARFLCYPRRVPSKISAFTETSNLTAS